MAWLRRLRDTLLRSNLERNLDDETRFHLDQRTAEYIQHGMTPEDARREALRRFGNVTLMTERARDVDTIPWLHDIRQDLSYGFRILRRSPGFAAVAVLSLAVGIGANTAIFSVFDTLLVKPLPVRSPEQLVVFDPMYQGRTSNGNTVYPLFERLRGLTAFFSETSVVADVDRSSVSIDGPATVGGDPSQVRVGIVSGNYFTTVGVDALIGRTFTADDDRATGSHPIAVISYAYWARRFARDPSVVGRTFTLSGTTYTIVGVTPRSFFGEWVGRPTDFWVPMTMVAQVMVEVPRPLEDGVVFHTFARLRPGVQIGEAGAAAQVVFQQFLRDTSGGNLTPLDRQLIATTRLDTEAAVRGSSPQRQSLGQPLVIAMLMVGLVLLIACANIANLLLARSAARQREITLRLAVGAGRGRIVRQLLTESVLLAAMGGALGLLFAKWGTDALVQFAGAGPVRNIGASLSLDLHPDVRVLAFTSALCLLTGLLFGVAPAWRASQLSISPALGDRSAGSDTSGGPFALGKLLVVSQVALSLMLLVGAALFVRTIRNLKSQDLGFDRQRVLLIWTAPGETGRWGAATASLYQTMEERIAMLPGVLAMSPSVYGLLQGNTGPGAILSVPGYVAGSSDDLRAQWSIVGQGFFDALGLPLLQGRNFTERDSTSAPQVAILNENMARHFFGRENPLGKHFDSWGVTKEVVGVVKDAKYESPREQGRRMFYLPYRQQLPRLTQVIALVVRAAGSPSSVGPRIRVTLREIDPRLPVIRVETIEDQLDNLLVHERLMADLSSFFGATAMLLSCLGLYGVMAHATSRRTKEIGVRLALGATRANVLGMVLRDTLAMTAAGIAIGVPATLATTRMISATLFGVSAADPMTILVAVVLMIAVSAFAGFVPAYGASRVDPMVALRCE